jgi:sugar phosphate isomerase/epimerase
VIAGREISLAPLTVLGTPPPEVVDAAARAGFDAIGLRVDNARPGVANPLLGDSALLRETLARVEDRGLSVFDVEITRLTPDLDAESLRPVFETAARAGARYVLVVGMFAELPRAADNFATLCDRAAEYGIFPVLEFMRFIDVATIDLADAIVAAAGRPNGGVLIDSLHVWRSGSSPAALAPLVAAHPERYPYLQFCDAPMTPPPDGDAGLYREAAGDRLAPGDGELPLGELLAVLPKRTPLSVEAPVIAWAGLDAAERARRIMAGLRRLLNDDV